LNKEEKGVILKLHVRPNSAKFDVGDIGSLEEELRVKVCSPARSGKANKELIKKLRKFFNSSIEIITGEKSNKKNILVHSSKENVLAALNQK
tara:strand:- start:7509 stop:7784 length:276 start_codon:yes stop_codon:yes gene_type:complete